MVRSGTVSKKEKEKQEKADREATLRAAEVPFHNSVFMNLCAHPPQAFSYVLERIAPQIYREEEFISAFLQVNDQSLTFADHMSMENYYRRQAARSAGLSAATAKIARGGMEFVFGFVPAELKTWSDVALAKDPLHVRFIVQVGSCSSIC